MTYLYKVTGNNFGYIHHILTKNGQYDKVSVTEAYGAFDDVYLFLKIHLISTGLQNMYSSVKRGHKTVHGIYSQDAEEVFYEKILCQIESSENRCVLFHHKSLQPPRLFRKLFERQGKLKIIELMITFWGPKTF